jgi:Tfp pilus assembly protein PilO
MNFILPLILILSSIGIFFGYVDTTYKGGGSFVEGKIETYSIKKLKGEYEIYQKALYDANEVKQRFNDLTGQKNSIPKQDKEKLEKLLPDNVDNIKLIVEFNEIAQKRRLSLKNMSVVGFAKSTDTIGPDKTPYGVLSLKFSVNTTYETFLSFVDDLERNLRLVDITDISFTSSDTGFYDFNVSLNTYWLK